MISKNNFWSGFNNLKINYKKDKKKMLLIISAIFLCLSSLCGTSFAYFTYISKTDNLTLIEAGTLALKFKYESNAIVLENVVPQADNFALSNNTEYEFDIENTGSLPANYTIVLNNSCFTTKTYEVNNEVITPDICVPNEYIKVAVKSDNGEYKVVETNEDEIIILDSDKLNSGKTRNYKMKIWLSYDTPNDYNALGIKNVLYVGNLGLLYEQRSLEVNKCNEISVLNNSDFSGANPPALSSNMIPVYYDTCNEVWKKADSTNQDEKYLWYNYDEKMWANSVTVSSTNRETYLNAEPGTEILMDDILTMQVWVPRYKYTVWNYNSDGTVGSEPQEIDITFESGTATSGEIGCTDNIQGTSDGTSSGTQPTTSEICIIKTTNEECTDSTCNGLTYTHPAFTFGDDELTGFWVGKFEVSSDTSCSASTSSAVGAGCNLTSIKPLVKPDVTSWRGAMVSIFENNMMTMNDSGNKYGFEIADDTHMIKNIEWGAVTYLSHSEYGTCTDGECTEVALNSYSSYMTGCGPQSEGSTLSGSKCNAYNTTLGKLSSTTGNIYGIYDMSGGAYDYVMGNIVSPDGETMMSGYRASINNYSGYKGIVYYGSSSGDYASYTGTYTYPDDKYYDKYSFNTSYSTRGRSKLGDGIKEVLNTSSEGWYSDYSYLAYSNNPWFLRGDNCNNGYGVGVFDSSGSSGYAVDSYSSRLVISQ